jgi:hypothetical protein
MADGKAKRMGGLSKKKQLIEIAIIHVHRVFIEVFTRLITKCSLHEDQKIF